MVGLSDNFLNFSLTHRGMFWLLNVYSINGMTSGKISEAKMVTIFSLGYDWNRFSPYCTNN
jgi:hypothetical protein